MVAIQTAYIKAVCLLLNVKESLKKNEHDKNILDIFQKSVGIGEFSTLGMHVSLHFLIFYNCKQI